MILFKGILIVWVVSVLHGTSTIMYLDNQKLDMIDYAREQAILNEIDPGAFVKMLDLESGFNPHAKGDFRSETGEYMAVGCGQFWPSTFRNYALKYGVEGTREDCKASISLAAKMIGDGEAHQWFNTAKKAGLL